MNSERITVRATAGDLNLGGDDFDNLLVDYCCRHLQMKGIDLKGNFRVLCRLRRACEKAKRELSFSVQTVIEVEVENISSDGIFEMLITRATFEKMCNELFERAILPVEKATNSIKNVGSVCTAFKKINLDRRDHTGRRLYAYAADSAATATHVSSK